METIQIQCRTTFGRTMKAILARSIIAASTLTALPSLSIAAPDWAATIDQLRTCIGKQDQACVAEVAETVAFELPPGQTIDYAKELPGIKFSSEKGSLLSNLSAHYALGEEPDKADKLYRLAVSDIGNESSRTVQRPIKAAREALAAAHLRAGNAKRFKELLDEVMDRKGNPSTLNGKVQTVSNIISDLGAMGAQIDEPKMGKLLADWLIAEAEAAHGSLFSNLFGSKQPEPVEKYAATLASRLVSNGFDNAAIEFAGHFDSKGVADAVAKVVQNREQKRLRIAKAIEQLEAGQAGRVVDELIANLSPRYQGSEVQKTAGLLHSLGNEVRQIAWELVGQNRHSLIAPLLLAASGHAKTIEDPVCRVHFMSRVMPLAAVVQDTGLLEQILDPIPVKNGRFDVAADAKCGSFPIATPYTTPRVLEAIVKGPSSVGALPPSPDTGTMDQEDMMAGTMMIIEMGPTLNVDAVAAFLTRASELEAAALNRDIALTSAQLAGIALQSGYSKVAFDLVKNGLQNASAVQDGSPSYEVSQAGSVRFISQTGTTENRTKAILSVLLNQKFLETALKAQSGVRRH